MDREPRPSPVEYLLHLLQAYRQEIATLDEEIHERTQQRQKFIKESQELVKRINLHWEND